MVRCASSADAKSGAARTRGPFGSKKEGKHAQADREAEGAAPWQITLQLARTHIGHDTHNAVVLDRAKFARNHADLEAAGDAAAHIALASSQSTRVNGGKVRRQVLQKVT